MCLRHTYTHKHGHGHFLCQCDEIHTLPQWSGSRYIGKKAHRKHTRTKNAAKAKHTSSSTYIYMGVCVGMFVSKRAAASQPIPQPHYAKAIDIFFPFQWAIRHWLMWGKHYSKRLQASSFILIPVKRNEKLGLSHTQPHSHTNSASFTYFTMMVGIYPQRRPPTDRATGPRPMAICIATGQEATVQENLWWHAHEIM